MSSWPRAAFSQKSTTVCTVYILDGERNRFPDLVRLLPYLSTRGKGVDPEGGRYGAYLYKTPAILT